MPGSTVSRINDGDRTNDKTLIQISVAGMEYAQNVSAEDDTNTDVGSVIGVSALVCNMT